jgi:class 3 adenylate cyclase/DNA-binding response OmpR family regulator
MEDSDIFADMLIGFLSSSEYSIERAVNGFEGIKKVYSFMPHLIITDIEMPLFKGYQVTRFLKSRKNTKTIPIIMFTTLGEMKDKFWGNQAGADFYIEKSPENFKPLKDAVKTILSDENEIDFAMLERESKKINDNTIIETVNNLLDSKLFQTTVIGMLNELSNKVQSQDMVIEGIFRLLNTVCEAEIAVIIIRGSGGAMYTYSANHARFTNEAVNDFLQVCASDFSGLFPDFQAASNYVKHFFQAKDTRKKILSYISVPLSIYGENFASVHIANSINEYFNPVTMENITVFLGAASPVIANALSMRELLELQKNTRAAFARYVPADVMDDLINGSAKKAYNSENRNVTVLFSDLKGFTAISEHSDAQSIVDFLNTWFAKMGVEILSEKGHIDKFIGDAIMAVFGAIQTLENSPVNAIKAAVKMLAAMDVINSSDTKLSRSKIEIGIGINYGECILGNIGFKNKMDYTIIGDTVNLASRIESLTRHYRYPLIASEYVYELTKDKFLYRKIDNVRVKGKAQPVGIYAVYSGFFGAQGKVLRSGETTELMAVPSLMINRNTLKNYNQGLQVFYLREWKLAQEYFEKALETDNDDYLCKLYINRAAEYSRTPPPDDWDGVITFDEK